MDQASVYTVVCYNGDSLGVQIDCDYTLLKFKEEIYAKWSFLRHVEYMLFGGIDDKEDIIDSDKSLQSLACCCFYKKIIKVDIRVSLIGSGSCSTTHVSSSAGLIGSGNCNKAHVGSSIASTSSSLSLVSVSNDGSEVRKSMNWGVAITGKGQRFHSKGDFLDALLKYSIALGFSFRKLKSDTKVYSANYSKKKTTGCEWYIRASVVHGIDNFFVVKVFRPEHNCGLLINNHKTPMRRELVMSSIIRHVRDKPSIKPKEIIDEMKRDYGVDINYYYARGGKKLAVNKIYGDEADSYSHLVSYMKTLRERDPGGHFVLEIDEDTKKFKRLFIGFEACITGFQYCMPLLFLDVCHLKTKFKGCMMAATGKNVDDAFDVVATTENDENWEWFLQNLKEVVSLQRPITFISDRHNSLLKFVPSVFPNSSHGYCYWHLKLNLRNAIKGKSRNRKFIEGLFKECAYAYTIREFEVKYNDLLVGSKDNKQDVLDFLSQVPFEHWANAHFPGCRYGDMCSSIAESFNSWVGEERCLSITSMLDRIRTRLMSQFSERRTCGNGWNSIIFPTIDNKLKERIDVGKTWQPPIKSSESVFEVHSIRINVVDLGHFSCTCGRWRVEGLPCAHALRCIIADGRSIRDFIDPIFSVLFYCQSYSHNIPPVDVDIGDFTVANEEVIGPPEVRKQPGRPKTNRIPNTGLVQQKGRFRSKICMTSAEWSEMTTKNRFDS